MATIQKAIDRYAEQVDYTEHAKKYLILDRWTGANPLLLLADAAGTTTGQNYYTHVKPSAESFKQQFLDSGRITSFDELACLDTDDPELLEIFEATRKRRVLIQGAEVLSNVDGNDDLLRVMSWAENADPFDHENDPFGRIRGVGLRTFQFLRMNAGVDTVKPDIHVTDFLKKLKESTDRPELDFSSDKSVLKSCKWLSQRTNYRMIELDQIAWWNFADTNGNMGRHE
jgi:hypothetical protein